MKKRFLSIVIAITLFTTSIFIPKNFTDILAANGEEIIPPGTYTLPANDEYDRTSAGWSLVWNDEFNGNSLNTKFWSADNNGYGGWNDELQFYKGTEGDNYYVDGGTLKIIAKREEVTGTGLDHYKKEVQNKKFDYTSARIQSQDKVAIKYGKLEARLRFDTFHGAWPAFWLYGNDGVAPRIGEIDILEATNRDNIAYGTAHWSIENPDAEDGVEVLHSGGSTGVPLNKDLDFSKFHVYGIEWSENQVIWYLDDEVYWTTQITDENMDDLRKSQYFLLNFAVGGEMTGISEYYGNTEQVDMGKTATMEVDWVRAYKKTTPSSSILVEESILESDFGPWIQSYGFTDEGTWAHAKGTVERNKYDEFEIKIDNVGDTWENWIIQNYLPDIELEPGKNYTLSFDIVSDQDKLVTTQLEQTDKVTGDTIEAWINGETIDLKSGKPQHIELQFYLPNDYEDNVKINFLLGNHGDENVITPTTITVTDLKLTTYTEYKPANYEFYSEVGNSVDFSLSALPSDSLLFGTIPATSTESATITNETAADANSGVIVYQSTKTGDDRFSIPVYERDNPGNSTTVNVTVHNYQVNPVYYVLDYGLSTDLLDTSHNNGMLSSNVLSINGVSTKYKFYGLTTEKSQQNYYQAGNRYQASLNNLTQGNVQVRVHGNSTAVFDDTTESSANVFYTPKKFMDDVDTFYYGIQVAKPSDIDSENKDATNATPIMDGKVEVMPANIVYYEDNFASSGTNANGTNGIIFSNNRTVGTDAQGNQSNSLTEQYGHDESYEAAGENSQGITHILNDGDTAIFSFKGTGFDISSRTTDTTGILQATVYDASQVTIEDGTVKATSFTSIVKTILVNTYYQNGNLYQVPVITWRSSSNEAKEYVVKLSAGGENKTVYIDGIRIYNPITGNSDVNEKYEAIGENGANKEEAKSLILGTTDYATNYGELAEGEGDLITSLGTPKASLIDYSTNTLTAGKTVVEAFTSYEEAGGTPGTFSDLITYAASGPNHELYLSNNYGIAFVAEQTSDSNATLQIGVKKVTGTGGIPLQYMKSDNSWENVAEISSSTESYYRLNEQFSDMPTDASGNPKVILRVVGGSDAILSMTYLNRRLRNATSRINTAFFFQKIK